jgi:hypothetical protein
LRECGDAESDKNWYDDFQFLGGIHVVIHSFKRIFRGDARLRHCPSMLDVAINLSGLLKNGNYDFRNSHSAAIGA